MIFEMGLGKFFFFFECFFGEVMGSDIWFHFLNMNDCMET